MKTKSKSLALLLLAVFFGWSCAAVSPSVYEQEEAIVTEEFEEIAEEEEEEGSSRLERWEILREMSERDYEE